MNEKPPPPEVGEPGDELLGHRGGCLVEIDRGRAYSSRGGVRSTLRCSQGCPPRHPLVNQTLVSVPAIGYQSMATTGRREGILDAVCNPSARDPPDRFLGVPVECGDAP
jgi:hypothetical protein